MNHKLAAFSAAIALATCGAWAFADAPTADTTVTDMPRFCAQQAGQPERYYPSRAQEREQEGNVVLDCVINGTQITSCTVAEENPAGWDFGAAALRIACHFTVHTDASGAPTLGSAPRDTSVSIGADNQTHARPTIRFRLAPATPPPPHP